MMPLYIDDNGVIQRFVPDGQVCEPQIKDSWLRSTLRQLIELFSWS